MALSPPTFVGVAACARCHGAETNAWRGSDHDLAMAEATQESVLGAFDGATITEAGITSRFFRRDGGFFVHTDGPDGAMADFEIGYTFGVSPLQQYLIAFPDGRLQALGIAWDSRPAEQGGQRWFHLYPGADLQAGNPLHWTGIDQTWNFQCAECHSTDLRKNYDGATNTYGTTWAEIDVACEACHGPGSAHVAWAQGGRRGNDGLAVHFDERRDVTWTLDPATGNARRSTPRASTKEVDTCGVCHGRTTKIAEPWHPGAPLLDSHVPALLYPGLFEADGKSLDEVYNYAPFLQSRMFAAGVTCGDCHDPHGLTLRATADDVCGQCHDRGVFAAPSHHQHAVDGAGARCTACHMPERTFMVVDPRHDHAFRIPRPDESVRFGTSNACTDCHQDRDAAWAAEAIERWHGPERSGSQVWTAAFAAARAGRPEAAPLLVDLAGREGVPAIVRATALEHLAGHPGRESGAVAVRSLADPDPLVRLGALRALRPYPIEQVAPAARGLLADPIRGVRIEAASLLATAPADRLAADDRARLEGALADYLAAQRVNADRPEHRVNLANLFLQRGQMADAEKELAAARGLDPFFVPAYLSLSQVHFRQGRDDAGERVLRDGLARVPENADLSHALGLNLVRQKRTADAIAALGRAAEMDPATPRYAYVYAVALHDAGQSDDALRTLEAGHHRHPADRDILVALVTYHGMAGHAARARLFAERLAALDPGVRPLAVPPARAR